MPPGHSYIARMDTIFDELTAAIRKPRRPNVVVWALYLFGGSMAVALIYLIWPLSIVPEKIQVPARCGTITTACG